MATTTITSHPLDTSSNGRSTVSPALPTPAATAPPKSRYYSGPPSPTSTPYNRPPPPHPEQLIGHTTPLSIIRIERDYSHSAPHVPQFYAAFPLELEKRITPTECTELINDVNEGLVRANHVGWAALDNALAVLSLWIWPLVAGSHYERVSGRHDDAAE